ncbi:hypothetical protein [Halococcus sp. AFM35]|uniref:hypothetical protein n=1 Tax=Halococcus sp. AFM35 TaxID=3421653 RepID=UPI003EBC668E
MKEDWDNLVILDACRFDMFDEQNPIPGNLQQRRSLGSDSWEFLQKNFAGGTFHNTVYVTANPYATRLPEGTFHAVVDLLDDEWDPEQRTVLPETVVAAAREAFEHYPDKRLIIHFMQPHYPFIGAAGDRLEHTGLARPDGDERADNKRHIWGSLRHGRARKEDVTDAYRENLNIVLPHVETLLESLSGKSVVSADHGNLLGERTSPLPVRGYGHPRGLNSTPLRTVPWLVVEGTDRRSVVAEPPVETAGPSERVVEQRLEALGYR